MGYKVEFSRQAEKDFSNLDGRIRALLSKWIDKYLEDSLNPRLAPSAKKLEGIRNGWRWRVGSYRLLGVIKDNRVIIEMFRIGHRKNVYRNLPRM